MDTFDTFINSEIYKNAVKELKNKISIKINSNYNEKTKKIDLHDLSISNITIADIKDFFENNLEDILNFAYEKIIIFDKEEDNGGDFPKGEGLGKDEKPVTIEELGYSKSFLIMYTIELYLLKNDPKRLTKYINDLKIPQGKKYLKELKEIFIKINNKSKRPHFA